MDAPLFFYDEGFESMFCAEHFLALSGLGPYWVVFPKTVGNEIVLAAELGEPLAGSGSSQLHHGKKEVLGKFGGVDLYSVGRVPPEGIVKVV